jgi:protocatechuate 3,4-dioxygenase alpha subunit
MRTASSSPDAWLGSTPSQTVGPFLSIGMTWEDGACAAAPGTTGAVWIRGRVLDGAGEPVTDAVVESWQADPDGRFDHPDDPRGARPPSPGFRGFARSATNAGGEYAIHTVKPGQLPDGAGGLQAPHLAVSVLARGLLDRVVTRIYFADEPTANAADDVLLSLDAAGRATLLAAPSADGYTLDIVLQGDHETVFFVL